MTSPHPGASGRSRRTVWVAALCALVAAGAVGWSATCPCDRTPGLVLLGSSEPAPVADWGFANDVPLCQVQVWTNTGPRAMNVTCMATPVGELFISCSNGAEKYWCGQVGQDEHARLRLNHAIYPVVLNRVVDRATLDRAWVARVSKLQVHNPSGAPVPASGAARPESWWSFEARSAGAS